MPLKGICSPSCDFFGGRALGDDYEAIYSLLRVRVGQAEVRLMKQRPLVDYAVKWLEQHRNQLIVD